MKTPKEQLTEWLEKKTMNEKDKWLSGVKNNFFAWSDFKEIVLELLEGVQNND